MKEKGPFSQVGEVKESLVFIYRLPTDQFSDEDCIKEMDAVLKMNPQHVAADEQLRKANELIQSWFTDPHSGAGEVLEMVVDLMLATVA